MPHTASLKIDEKEYPLAVMVGTEGEKAIDTRKLRTDTGFICYDQGYGNTGSCESSITYLDAGTVRFTPSFWARTSAGIYSMPDRRRILPFL